MSNVRAWLRLIRVRALPTALADVWLGAAVAGAFFTTTTIWLSLISLALYASGMILNDVHDVEADWRDNPNRPIPLGLISRRAAATAGFLLIALALVIAACVSVTTLIAAAALAALIIGYDFLIKRSALLGPLNMGLCRAFNVLLGLSIVGCGTLQPHWFAALPVLIYVTSVSILARQESDVAPPRTAVSAVGMMASLAVVTIILIDKLAYEGPRGFGGFSALLLGTGIVVIDRYVRRTKNVRRTVTLALAGIIPLEALVAAAHFHFLPAAIILSLMVPVFLLRKLSHIT